MPIDWYDDRGECSSCGADVIGEYYCWACGSDFIQEPDVQDADEPREPKTVIHDC